MYKFTFFFQKMNDLPAFEAYLSKQIIPQLLEFPKILRVQITSVGPSVDPTPENLASIQLILELYFKSMEENLAFMESSNGANLIDLIVNNPFGETSTFFGNESHIDLTK